MRTMIEQTLVELEAKAEIETTKHRMIHADPAHTVTGRDTDFEQHHVAPATGEAIRAMIREVCGRFEVDPREIGYLVAA